MFFESQFPQNTAGNASFLTQKSNQDMFATDIAVIEPFRLFLSKA
jgi:hypothetical protein